MALNFLRDFEGGFKSDGNIVGDMSGANRYDGGMNYIAFFIYHYAGCRGADVYERDAYFFLFLGEDGAGGGNRIKNNGVNTDAGLVNGVSQVANVGARRAD